MIMMKNDHDGNDDLMMAMMMMGQGPESSHPSPWAVMKEGRKEGVWMQHFHPVFR